MPKALSTLVAVERVVVSDVERPTRSASTSRRCSPSERAAATTDSARPGATTDRVSKNAPCSTSKPPARNASAITAA